MSDAPLVRIEVLVPRRIYEALVRAEQSLGIKREDIVARAILKALEELGEQV